MSISDNKQMWNALNLTVVSLAIVGLVYLVSVFGYVWGHRPGMAIAFFGYVISNGGLIWDAIQQAKP